MFPRTFKLSIVIALSLVANPLNFAYAQQYFEILEGRNPPEGPLPYNLEVKTETVIKDLGGCGVSFAFLPDGRIICGELKTGKVRMIENNVMLPQPLLELDIYHGNKSSGIFDERGLTGLTIDPNFSQNHYVYLHWTYLVSEPEDSARRIARFTLVDNQLTDMKILLDGIPAAEEHVGGPLEFGPDGKLYITGGDAGTRGKAQSLNFPVGKTLRINPDGSIPSDNPFPGLPYYTVGHRNVFGITFHPITGVPYITENGDNTDDEINLLQAGKNYGWPTVWGYSNDPNFVSPLLSTGNITIAPTEITFYTGDKYPSELTNNMLFLSYNFRSLFTAQLSSPGYDKIVSFQRHPLPQPPFGSYTDIEQGPDGYLYISEFNSISRLLITKQLSASVVMEQPSSTSSGSTLLSAKLIDYTGKPVANVPLNFLASGKPAGTANTNSEGVAEVPFTPSTAGNYSLSASFAGNDKFHAASSPSITFRVEESSTSHILEAMSDNGFQVRLTILPSVDPNNNSSMSFKVEFIDPRNGGTLESIPYVVEIVRDDKILFSEHAITSNNPTNLHSYNFDQSGPAQITIKEINNSQSSVEFAISVVPEFPIYVAMLVLLLGLMITIVLTNTRRNRLFDHP